MSTPADTRRLQEAAELIDRLARRGRRWRELQERRRQADEAKRHNTKRPGAAGRQEKGEQDNGR